MGVLRTALYCRLSKDDMAQGDSESIRTQKAMLTQYAREHNFLVVEVYVDDGELPDGRAQILHVDRMCNECGNCLVFCPYDSAPYKDKFTLFHDRAGFDESVNNQGFLPLGGSKVLVRLNGKVEEIDLDETNDLPAGIEILIYTVLTRYSYLVG